MKGEGKVIARIRMIVIVLVVQALLVGSTVMGNGIRAMLGQPLMSLWDGYLFAAAAMFNLLMVLFVVFAPDKSRKG